MIGLADASAHRLGLTIVGVVHLCACASVPSPQARDARLTTQPVVAGREVSQLELQQSIQRFTGEFFDGVTQSFEAAKSADPKLQDASMRRMLLYGSSALDIASGPQPELNVLDMIVFVSLSRQTLESHWVPHVFGAHGRPLVGAFERAEQDLQSIADTILSAEQQRQLHELIQTWRTANPDQTRVEWVRFRDFSIGAEGVARERAQAARGLLGAVRAASHAADQAVLLGERALFVSHRLPFLVRLHARLGVHETLEDSLQLLEGSGAIQAQTAQLDRLVAKSAELTQSVESAAREGRLLYRDVEPLLRSLRILESNDGASPSSGGVDLGQALQLVESSHRLVEQSQSVLQELRGLSAGVGSGESRTLDWWLERWLQRCLFYLALLGAAWAVCFWGGYYLAKRAIARRARDA